MPLPNDPVLPTLATMQWVEDRLKKLQMQVGPMKRGPKRWPQKGGGGNLDSKFAVVSLACGGGTKTGDGETFVFTPETPVGEAYLLEWVYEDNAWKLKVPENSEPVECVSGYTEVNIPVGAFVQLDFRGGLTPGYTISATNKPPIATFVEIADYMRALSDYNKTLEQGMSHDADSDTIHWTGVEC